MRRLALLTLPLLASAGGCHRQAPPAPQAQPTAVPSLPAPEGPTVDTSHAGRPIPASDLRGPTDAPSRLTDLKGKPLLVNLWATWCVPCVKELPTLDALATRTAGRLTIVPVNQDLEGRRVVTPFLQKHAFKTLTPWLDTSNALMLQLKEASLPVTVLYGADGKELWRVRGDLDWTGSKAKALLAQAGI